MADDVKDVASGSRVRRGAFPRMALEPVLQLVDGIFELGHGDPVRRRTAFEHVSRSPESSISYALNAAANGGYGVVQGGKTAQYLSLTAAGRRIAEANSKGERLAAIYDVLFENEYFAAIIDKYADRPQPQDSIAVDFLQREHGLSASDAETCWTIAKENITTYGLYEDSGGKRVILSREEAGRQSGTHPRPKPNTSSANEAAEENESTAETHSAGQVPGRLSPKLTPQITFNIQVVLPVDGTPEVYDAIFASMAEHLLGRGE